LEALGIAYALDHRLMRGLDYYSRTTFELIAEGLGAQNAVAGGGRYDGLVETLGGPSVPAVGFAAGLDRILLRLAELLPAPPRQAMTFLVALDEASWKASLPLLRQLRRAGLRAETDVRRGSLKAQMKRADKLGAAITLILGGEELAQGVVTLRDMASAAADADKQTRIPMGEVLKTVRARLGSAKPEGAGP
jgi:histidyl-tRNA synthetase